MSIRTKLTFIFLAIALLPLLFISILSYVNFKNSLEATRFAQLNDLSAFRADRIEAYFAGLKADMEIAQGYFNIKENLPILTILANHPENPKFVAAKKMLGKQLEQMQSVSNMADILLIAPNGKVVYTNRSKLFPKDLSKSLDAQRKAFEQGKKSVYFSEIYFDSTNDKRFEMMVTAPVTDFNGAFIGVIGFEVDMMPVYNLIQNATGLGSTGEVLVGRKIDNHVEFLNPLRHDPHATLSRKAQIGDLFSFPIQQAVQGKTGSGIAIDYRGMQVIAAWRYIPALNWGLVAKIDTREAFADVTNLRNLMLIILALVFIVSCIGAMFIAHSISGPIKKLTLGAEIIGQGNLDHKVGTASKDETGQLSRTFDKMTHDLKEITASRNELNNEIALRKRTEDALRNTTQAALDLMEMQKKREEELYKLNRMLDALSKSSQAMTRTLDEQEFLDAVCRIVVEDCGYTMVWIGFAQDDEEKSIKRVAHYGFDEGYLDSLKLSWADNENGRGPTGIAIRTGAISQCRNMQTDSLFSPWRKEAIKRGYASSISIPLIMYNKPFGAITIYSNLPDAIAESEAQLLVDLSNDLAYGVTTIRLRTAHVKAEDLLRNEHNLMNTILQTTGGLILAIDPEGRIKIFNHSCELVTGYQFSEIKDKIFWDTLLMPEDVEKVKKSLGNTMNMPVKTEYENYMVTRDGTCRFIRWTYSSVTNKKGEVELVICTGIDITERKQAEIELEKYQSNLENLVMARTAELHASEKQLVRANEMKLLGQLTSGVAHEVRNPLNGILAIMGALAKELSDNENFQVYIQHMRNQVNRLTVLMEDLLLLGRPVATEKMINIPFVKTVQNSLASWQQGLQTPREVTLYLPKDDEFIIKAEIVKIDQLIVNLLDNAHQHSSTDKMIEISICDSGNGEVIFFVKDNGKGIPPENISRIFEPFFTTRKGGTGLGLSIIRHIVESYGGRIRAFNNEDCAGSKFEVRFPFVKETIV